MSGLQNFKIHLCGPQTLKAEDFYISGGKAIEKHSTTNLISILDYILKK